MSLSSISLAGYEFTAAGGTITGLGSGEVACIETSTEALNILRRPDIDADVYLPGSTVTSYGAELVTSGQISLSAAQSLAITGSTIVSGKQYAVNIPTGTQLSITSGYTVTGNGAVQVVTANASGWATIYSSGGVSNFTPSIREVITTSSVTAGLPTNNYTLSDGSTGYSAVDGTAGLVLDGAGSVGAERVTNGGLDSASGWTISSGAAISGGVCSFPSANSQLSGGVSVTAGETYLLSYDVIGATGGLFLDHSLGGVFVGGAVIGASSGTKHFYITATSSDGLVLLNDPGSTGSCSIDNISVREVTGIHATQATTANKGTLRYTSGRYRWEFDATDSLTATYPAGYESVTVIDAKSTGQVTTAGANIVGAYSMGPNVTLYGRFVIKGTLSAGELATLQRFANQIAGA